jgi:hypothetical protein
MTRLDIIADLRAVHATGGDPMSRAREIAGCAFSVDSSDLETIAGATWDMLCKQRAEGDVADCPLSLHRWMAISQQACSAVTNEAAIIANARRLRTPQASLYLAADALRCGGTDATIIGHLAAAILAIKRSQTR